MEQLFGIVMSPMLIILGILATLASPFGWLFILLCFALVFVAGFRAKKETEFSVRQWALGIFLVTFWFAHLASEGKPTVETYPCGRTQGPIEGGCEVWSTAGFPLPALHYFPAGDVPYLGMWPAFFINAAIFALVSIFIARVMPKRVLEHNVVRKIVLGVGAFLMLVGQAIIMLRFD